MKLPAPTTAPTTSKSPRRGGLAMLLPTSPSAVSIEAPADAELGATEQQGGLLRIPVEQVERNASQPRTHFDPDAIHSLATSIEANGIIQPIAVREISPGRYQIIAGERRWLAAQRVGLATVPAVVHDVDERETLVLALVENLVREDLGPLETARAYAALQDEFEMSVADLARSVGRSRPAVANTLRLLELPDDVLAMIEQGRLTEGHGRALLGAKDRLRQARLARLAVDQSLTVRSLEQLVREGLDDAPPRAAAIRTTWNLEPSSELVDALDALLARLPGVRARVKVGERGGKLELSTGSPADLLETIARLEDALVASA